MLALEPDQPAVIIATENNLATPLPDERQFTGSRLQIAAGQDYSPRKLSEKLMEHGYEAAYQVEYPGQLSSRGGILDIWPHAEEYPIRLDFFGDEIDEIRQFDAATQRSMASLKKVSFPLMLPDEDALKDLTGGLLTYLPPNTLPIFIERRDSLQKLEAQRPFMRGEGKKARLEAIDEFFSSLPRVEISIAEVMDRRGAINLETRDFQPLSGGAEAACEAVNDLKSRRYSIDVHAGSGGEANRFETALASHEVELNAARVLESEISSSVLFLDHNEAVLSGADLLGKERLRRGLTGDELSLSNAPHRAIDDFVRLEKNDYVVHINHGIARYKGIEELRSPDGSRGEFMRLEFDEGTEIHVPVTNADAVQKYIGTRGSAPKLSKYNSKKWGDKKRAVQQAVLKLAADMLKLQALRMTESGTAYNIRSDMLVDFVESFPYRDTPDQEKAWLDIQADLERTRPMDRLICGDVGFGKTELAMRAAFAAVMEGKQVAVLVPTTVLCQQHFLSFSKRMKGFPVIVDSISRFKSKAEQKRSLEALKQGKVDILIGTHRLVSKDVHFNELGLIVIDEEQKFGVEHKERLKQMRSTVDVMTLSATPIPRTLHMSLLGLRDISSLTTPPEHRKPVATSAHKFNERFITEQIRNELQRDGQVYFVHNRVQDIVDLAAKIKGLVPEARVGVGHGQMKEGELEKVMIKFIEGEIDVLVCTTIIESGIDVHRANTMFIDRADRYGLANLHQLRGRVGRYRNNAYCFLLVPEQANLKEVADKRLRAILQHSRLGSGFYIAMRDLEIRGAGNIIGKEQSGFIASVGYDLYCQMLEQAVRQLKGGYVVNEVETNVDLDIDTVLPRNYIKGQDNRAEAYRLIARCRTPEQSEQVAEELKDRFGKAPKKIDTLLKLAVIRHRLGQLGITGITVGRLQKTGPSHFKIKAVSAKATLSRIKESNPRIRLVDDTTMSLPLGHGMKDPMDQLRYLWNMLQTMARKGIVRDPNAPIESETATEE